MTPAYAKNATHTSARNAAFQEEVPSRWRSAWLSGRAHPHNLAFFNAIAGGPSNGYVAISVTLLNGVPFGARERDFYKPLRDRRPAAVIGGSIRVYWVGSSLLVIDASEAHGGMA